MAELNQEKLRQRIIEIYENYVSSKGSSKSITEIKLLVKEYDPVMDLLDETLNCSIGILDAIVKGEIKDEKEKQQLIKEITAELHSKDYLGVGDPAPEEDEEE
jgi:hypothetical protein